MFLSVNAHLENILTHYSQVRLYVYTHICAKHITYKVTYGAVREPLFLTWACQIALYLISHYRGYYLHYGNTGCGVFKGFFAKNQPYSNEITKF